MTAKEWRDINHGKEGNIRDHSTLEQLVVLSNLESINSVIIEQGLNQKERVIKLNEIAITQMRSLIESSSIKKIETVIMY